MTSRVSSFISSLPLPKKEKKSKKLNETVTEVAASSLDTSNPADFETENSEFTSKAITPMDRSIKRTIKNAQLLDRISKAIAEGTSLDFIDQRKLDADNLPVPSKQLLVEAVEKLNRKAIKFCLNMDPSRSEGLAAIIFEELFKIFTNENDLRIDPCIKFILEIILDNQPKLDPCFLHRYFVDHWIRAKVKDQDSDSEDSSSEFPDNDLQTYVYILGIVDRCYKLNTDLPKPGTDCRKVRLRVVNGKSFARDLNALNERSLECTARNLDFLKKIDAALESDQSLGFIDEETLNPENLPAPRLELLRTAVSSLNSRVVRLFFELDSPHTKRLGKLIYYQLRKLNTKNQEKYVKFVTEIIQENQPNLNPDFLAVYAQKQAREEENDDLRSAFIETINRCFQVQKHKKV